MKRDETRFDRSSTLRYVVGGFLSLPPPPIPIPPSSRFYSILDIIQMSSESLSFYLGEVPGIER